MMTMILIAFCLICSIPLALISPNRAQREARHTDQQLSTKDGQLSNLLDTLTIYRSVVSFNAEETALAKCCQTVSLTPHIDLLFVLVRDVYSWFTFATLTVYNMLSGSTEMPPCLPEVKPPGSHMDGGGWTGKPPPPPPSPTQPLTRPTQAAVRTVPPSDPTFVHQNHRGQLPPETDDTRSAAEPPSEQQTTPEEETRPSRRRRWKKRRKTKKERRTQKETGTTALHVGPHSDEDPDLDVSAAVWMSVGVTIGFGAAVLLNINQNRHTTEALDGERERDDISTISTSRYKRRTRRNHTGHNRRRYFLRGHAADSYGSRNDRVLRSSKRTLRSGRFYRKGRRRGGDRGPFTPPPPPQPFAPIYSRRRAYQIQSSESSTSRSQFSNSNNQTGTTESCDSYGNDGQCVIVDYFPPTHYHCHSTAAWDVPRREARGIRKRKKRKRKSWKTGWRQRRGARKRRQQQQRQLSWDMMTNYITPHIAYNRMPEIEDDTTVTATTSTSCGSSDHLQHRHHYHQYLSPNVRQPIIDLVRPDVAAWEDTEEYSEAHSVSKMRSSPRSTCSSLRDEFTGPWVSTSLSFVVYDLDVIDDIPNEVMEVLCCNSRPCYVHPHDRYHYVGNKIIVQRLPLPPPNRPPSPRGTPAPATFLPDPFPSASQPASPSSPLAGTTTTAASTQAPDEVRAGKNDLASSSLCLRGTSTTPDTRLSTRVCFDARADVSPGERVSFLLPRQEQPPLQPGRKFSDREPARSQRNATTTTTAAAGSPAVVPKQASSVPARLCDRGHQITYYNHDSKPHSCLARRDTPPPPLLLPSPLPLPSLLYNERQQSVRGHTARDLRRSSQSPPPPRRDSSARAPSPPPPQSRSSGSATLQREISASPCCSGSPVCQRVSSVQTLHRSGSPCFQLQGSSDRVAFADAHGSPVFQRAISVSASPPFPDGYRNRASTTDRASSPVRSVCSLQSSQTCSLCNAGKSPTRSPPSTPTPKKRVRVSGAKKEGPSSPPKRTRQHRGADVVEITHTSEVSPGEGVQFTMTSNSEIFNDSTELSSCSDTMSVAELFLEVLEIGKPYPSPVQKAETSEKIEEEPEIPEVTEMSEVETVDSTSQTTPPPEPPVVTPIETTDFTTQTTPPPIIVTETADFTVQTTPPPIVITETADFTVQTTPPPIIVTETTDFTTQTTPPPVIIIETADFTVQTTPPPVIIIETADFTVQTTPPPIIVTETTDFTTQTTPPPPPPEVIIAETVDCTSQTTPPPIVASAETNTEQVSTAVISTQSTPVPSVETMDTSSQMTPVDVTPEPDTPEAEDPESKSVEEENPEAEDAEEDIDPGTSEEPLPSKLLASPQIPKFRSPASGLRGMQMIKKTYELCLPPEARPPNARRRSRTRGERSVRPSASYAKRDPVQFVLNTIKDVYDHCMNDINHNTGARLGMSTDMTGYPPADGRHRLARADAAGIASSKIRDRRQTASADSTHRETTPARSSPDKSQRSRESSQATGISVVKQTVALSPEPAARKSRTSGEAATKGVPAWKYPHPFVVDDPESTRGLPVPKSSQIPSAPAVTGNRPEQSTMSSMDTTVARQQTFCARQQAFCAEQARKEQLKQNEGKAAKSSRACNASATKNGSTECELFRELKEKVALRNLRRQNEKDKETITPSCQGEGSGQREIETESPQTVPAPARPREKGKTSQSRVCVKRTEAAGSPQKVCLVTRKSSASVSPTEKTCIILKQTDKTRSPKRVCVISQTKGPAPSPERPRPTHEKKNNTSSPERPRPTHEKKNNTSSPERPRPTHEKKITPCPERPRPNNEKNTSSPERPRPTREKKITPCPETFGHRSPRSENEDESPHNVTFTKLNMTRFTSKCEARSTDSSQDINAVVGGTLVHCNYSHTIDALDNTFRGPDWGNAEQLFENQRQRQLCDSSEDPVAEVSKSIQEVYDKCLALKPKVKRKHQTKNNHATSPTARSPLLHGELDEKFPTRKSSSPPAIGTGLKGQRVKSLTTKEAHSDGGAAPERSSERQKRKTLETCSHQTDDNDNIPILPLVFSFPSSGKPPSPNQDSSENNARRASPGWGERKDEPYRSLSRASVTEPSPPWEVSDRAKNNVFSAVGWTSPRSGITSLFRGQSSEKTDSADQNITLNNPRKASQASAVDRNPDESRSRRPVVAEHVPETPARGRNESRNEGSASQSVPRQQANDSRLLSFCENSNPVEGQAEGLCSAVKPVLPRQEKTDLPPNDRISLTQTAATHQPRIISAPRSPPKSQVPVLQKWKFYKAFPSKPNSLPYTTASSTENETASNTRLAAEGQQKANTATSEPTIETRRASSARDEVQQPAHRKNSQSSPETKTSQDSRVKDKLRPRSEKGKALQSVSQDKRHRSVDGGDSFPRHKLCALPSDINEELKKALHQTSKPSAIKKGKRKRECPTAARCESITSYLSAVEPDDGPASPRPKPRRRHPVPTPRPASCSEGDAAGSRVRDNVPTQNSASLGRIEENMEQNVCLYVKVQPDTRAPAATTKLSTEAMTVESETTAPLNNTQWNTTNGASTCFENKHKTGISISKRGTNDSGLTVVSGIKISSTTGPSKRVAETEMFTKIQCSTLKYPQTHDQNHRQSNIETNGNESVVEDIHHNETKPVPSCTKLSRIPVSRVRKDEKYLKENPTAVDPKSQSVHLATSCGADAASKRRSCIPVAFQTSTQAAALSTVVPKPDQLGPNIGCQKTRSKLPLPNPISGPALRGTELKDRAPVSALISSRIRLLEQSLSADCNPIQRETRPIRKLISYLEDESTEGSGEGDTGPVGDKEPISPSAENVSRFGIGTAFYRDVVRSPDAANTNPNEDSASGGQPENEMNSYYRFSPHTKDNISQNHHGSESSFSSTHVASKDCAGNVASPSITATDFSGLSVLDLIASSDDEDEVVSVQAQHTPGVTPHVSPFTKQGNSSDVAAELQYLASLYGDRLFPSQVKNCAYCRRHSGKETSTDIFSNNADDGRKAQTECADLPTDSARAKPFVTDRTERHSRRGRTSIRRLGTLTRCRSDSDLLLPCSRELPDTATTAGGREEADFLPFQDSSAAVTPRTTRLAFAEQQAGFDLDATLDELPESSFLAAQCSLLGDSNSREAIRVIGLPQANSSFVEDPPSSLAFTGPPCAPANSHGDRLLRSDADWQKTRTGEAWPADPGRGDRKGVASSVDSGLSLGSDSQPDASTATLTRQPPLSAPVGSGGSGEFPITGSRDVMSAFLATVYAEGGGSRRRKRRTGDRDPGRRKREKDTASLPAQGVADVSRDLRFYGHSSFLELGVAWVLQHTMRRISSKGDNIGNLSLDLLRSSAGKAELDSRNASF